MIDDARRKMSKLKCPYCHKRVADLATKDLRNISTLERYEGTQVSNLDIILECPHCHHFVVFSMKIKRINELASVNHLT